MIRVDSRTRDIKTEMVIKYVSPNGNPIQYKPIRKIEPSIPMLSPLARFIVENESGTYIGGFLHRKNDVHVEGPIGSKKTLTIQERGQEMADKIEKIYGLDKNERAECSYLFPVFEPNDDETEYFNSVAEKIRKLAQPGGRVIINKNIFDIN